MKAEWRAYESVAEGGVASQWVFIGRYFPDVIEINFVGGFGGWGCDGPIAPYNNGGTPIELNWDGFGTATANVDGSTTRVLRWNSPFLPYPGALGGFFSLIAFVWEERVRIALKGWAIFLVPPFTLVIKGGLYLNQHPWGQIDGTWLNWVRPNKYANFQGATNDLCFIGAGSEAYLGNPRLPDWIDQENPIPAFQTWNDPPPIIF